MNIGEVILHQILDENNGEMDAKVLNNEVERRLDMIQKELDSKDKIRLPLGYCVICGQKFKNKKRTLRRIHDIIYHFGYYCEQMGIKIKV